MSGVPPRCLCSQFSLKVDYPTLKLADPCPVCATSVGPPVAVGAHRIQDQRDLVFTDVPYPATPLTSANCTSSLQQAITPIRIPPMDWQHTRFDAAQVLQASIAVVGTDGNCDGDLGKALCDWMINDKDGTSEDGLHVRDTALMKIIRFVAGLSSERNKVSFSTFNTSRSDVYLYLPGLPPLVHVEEKAAEGELNLATQELAAKFCSTLPHYHQQLQFIMGIAFAGNHVSFGKLPIGGAGGWQLIHSFDVSNLSQRLQCVQAAVNVGRWCLHAIAPANPLVSPVPQRFGYTQSTPVRDITLLSEGVVIKLYKQLTPQQLEWLRQLYTGIAVPAAGGAVGRIRFMEWATHCHVKSPCSLELRLMPFGVVADTRLPRNLDELRAALRCILTCLQELHAAGWTHLDLRWSNVVFIAPGHWTVIDAEFARPFGSAIPAALKRKDPEVITADAAADCYLVGQMMKDLEALVATNLQAQALCDALLAPGRERSRRQARALAHAFLAAPAAAAAAAAPP